MVVQSKRRELKKWVVNQFMAIELDLLDEDKRLKFIDLMIQMKDNDFVQDCFNTFIELKKEFYEQNNDLI